MNTCNCGECFACQMWAQWEKNEQEWNEQYEKSEAEFTETLNKSYHDYGLKAPWEE